MTYGVSGSATVTKSLTAISSLNTAVGAITIDRNFTGTDNIGSVAGTGIDPSGLAVDYDVTGIVGSGKTAYHDAVAIHYNQDAPTHVGTVNATGVDLRMTGGTSGTQAMKGVAVVLAGADNNTGLDIQVPDGGTHFVARSGANISDQFRIEVTTNGATTLTTQDGSGADANLTVTVDGKIALDAAAEIVVNEASADIDFRVESNNKTHMLFVDGGTEKDWYRNCRTSRSSRR